jgi:hypothetical protein
LHQGLQSFSQQGAALQIPTELLRMPGDCFDINLDII